MPSVLASPEPAATVVLLQPVGSGFQVLMVERNQRGFFGNLHVFPGGRVEPGDLISGATRPDDGAHRLAALRELAEETGILLTREGAIGVPGGSRAGLHTWLEGHPGALATGSLILISRWVTPEMVPTRFDTRFYLAVCENSPEVVIDTEELVGHAWVAPGDALERHDRGEWAMMLPTIAHLRWLERRTSIDEAVASAQGADGRTMVRPQRLADGSIVPVLLPEGVG